MGRIGKLIKTEIEKFIVATVETRFKFNQSCDMYASSGDDAPPLEKDRIALIEIDGTGKMAAVGVLWRVVYGETTSCITDACVQPLLAI